MSLLAASQAASAAGGSFPTTSFLDAVSGPLATGRAAFNATGGVTTSGTGLTISTLPNTVGGPYFGAPGANYACKQFTNGATANLITINFSFSTSTSFWCFLYANDTTGGGYLYINNTPQNAAVLPANNKWLFLVLNGRDIYLNGSYMGQTSFTPSGTSVWIHAGFSSGTCAHCAVSNFNYRSSLLTSAQIRELTAAASRDMMYGLDWNTFSR